MMEPQAEAQSLKTEPLPVSEKEKTIPTQIHTLDIHISLLKENLAHLQAQVNDAESDRRILISKAKEYHITTDSNYKIVEIPLYPKKHVDVELLRTKYEDKYTLIIANKRAQLRDKIESETQKLLDVITQADLKAVVKDKAALAMLIPEPKEPSGFEVNVVRR